MIDATSLLKKGDKSVDSAHRDAGTTGQDENWQGGAFIVDASPHARALLARALSLLEARAKAKLR